MTTYLLDVNLLLALSDPMHSHHHLAHTWFARKGNLSWATCPLTENGFVRIASQPRYPNRPGDVQVVLAILRQFCQQTGHVFWPDEVTLRDVLLPNQTLTHNNITDIYLLGLAVYKKGKLATLDQRIPADMVQDGVNALEIIV